MARWPLVFVIASVSEASAQPVRISIGDAMRLATGKSHPLAVARANVERADADVTSARSGLFPQIVVSGSYLRTLASEFDAIFEAPDILPMDTGADVTALPFGREHTWRGGVDVNQLLWDGGRTLAGVSSAQSARDLAQIDERSRRAQVVLAVVEAYYGAVLASDTVAISEASLALAERTLAQARVGYEQGTTAEFDVVRAEVTRDNQRTAVLRARADRDDAFDRLRQLTGVAFDRPLQLSSTLGGDEATNLAVDAAGLPRSTTRYAVAQAQVGVATTQADVRAARAEWWPQLSAFTSYGRVQYPLGFWPDDSDWRENWTIGVNVSFPVFTGFRRGAQIRAARASERAAQQQLAEAEELAVVDERRAHRDADVAGITVRDTRRSVELARRAYQIAEVRYAQGVSTFLELVDARIALDQAQLNFSTAQRDLQVATVRIALLPALPLGDLPAGAVPAATALATPARRTLLPATPVPTTQPSASTTSITGAGIPGTTGRQR